MFIKDWKKDVLTIPNMLSLFRLVLIPVYIVIYLNVAHVGTADLARIRELSAAFGEKCCPIKSDGVAVFDSFAGKDLCGKFVQVTVCIIKLFCHNILAFNSFILFYHEKVQKAR